MSSKLIYEYKIMKKILNKTEIACKRKLEYYQK